MRSTFVDLFILHSTFFVLPLLFVPFLRSGFGFTLFTVGFTRLIRSFVVGAFLFGCSAFTFPLRYTFPLLLCV